MTEIISDGNALLFRSRYDPGLVAALKAAIPATDRTWDPDAKAWIVTPAHGDTLARLALQYLGENVSMPLIPAKKQRIEPRILEVRYIGRTRERGDGQRSAFGWCGGGWTVIFPEAALKRWFGVLDSDRPTYNESTLYTVLGIPRKAEPREIRAAYRRLARQWHPDVCREPDAAEQFIAIQRAYELLSNPNARLRYDAGLALQASTRTPDLPLQTQDGYRSPLRCGQILAEGYESLTRFVVTAIKGWLDIIDDQGRTLVTSWSRGADTFEEEWIT